MARLLACLTLCTLLTSAVTVASAQYPRRPSVRGETKSMSGEVTQVSGNRVMWEADGKTGPIPFDRATQWSVEGEGDAGFLRQGAVVTVQGIFKPEDTKIILASLDVHRTPQSTARPGNITVQTADPNITVKGTVVSMDPLVVRAMDSITLVKGSSANGQRSRPVSGAVLKVEPRGGKVESVGLILGSAPQLIAAGDSVTVTVNSLRPNVASAITVRKSEPLKSTPPKSEGTDKRGKKPAETAKPEAGDDEKSSDKAEGEAAAEGEGDKPAEADGDNP